MTAFKSDFLNILQERGFIHQCSDFEGIGKDTAHGRPHSLQNGVRLSRHVIKLQGYICDTCLRGVRNRPFCDTAPVPRVRLTCTM